jgi:hypothetical protein
MPSLEWSESSPPIELACAEDLDRALEHVALHCSPEHPIIVALYVHGQQLLLALGSPQSFVQVQAWDSGRDEPALVTVGGPEKLGVVSFYFLGSHHTEIPERNLIPTSVALGIAKQFLQSGRRSEDVAWETA